MSGLTVRRIVSIFTLAIFAVAAGRLLWAEPPGPPEPPPQEPEMESQESGLEVPDGMRRLVPKMPVWVDKKQKLVAVDGKICLRAGALEFFACPSGTKDYESLISIPVKPQYVQAALLVIGAQKGRPAQFQPKYEPATGDEVDIFVMWKDAQGQLHKVRAQELVQDARSRKEMQDRWVFAGSGFWKDEVSGEENFLADSGEFICLANLPGAMLDVTAQRSRSAAHEGRSYIAFTERVPPVGTKVRLLLVPRITARKGEIAPADKPAGAVPGKKPVTAPTPHADR